MHNIFVVVVVSLFSNDVQSKITKYCIITYTHETRWYIAGGSQGAEAHRAGNRSHE